MGLTIHYSLKSDLADLRKIKRAVGQMRDLALQLPFKTISDIVYLKGKECVFDRQKKPTTKAERLISGLVSSAGICVVCPWNPRIRMPVDPIQVIAFSTWPGDGCESADFGLCRYPETVEWGYDPEDDKKFEKVIKNGGSTTWRFSYDKWHRHHQKHMASTSMSTYAHKEVRQVPVKRPGWSWSSFCKTEYAANPAHGGGGLPHFLRCHMSVIALLDRMAKLDGVRVMVNDEGQYARSIYSDDYREAAEANRKPTYVVHPGLYNPSKLLEHIRDDDEFTDTLKEQIPILLRGPSRDVGAQLQPTVTFETLDFKGRNARLVDAFLKILEPMAKARVQSYKRAQRAHQAEQTVASAE